LVGIVLVSHSAELARGLAALAGQVAGSEVRIEPAGGDPEGGLGTTGELGGLWRYRGRAPQRVVGVGFASQGWGGACGYRRLPDSFDPRAAFIFAGIGAEEIT